jgi:hypothetical protein
MPRIVNGPLRRALIVENPHKELDQLLIEGGMEVVRIDKTPDEDELIRLLGEHKSQILFKRSQVPVTRRVLESAPDLLVVQLCAIGDDSVDKAAAAELGVLVFNDPRLQRPQRRGARRRAPSSASPAACTRATTRAAPASGTSPRRIVLRFRARCSASMAWGTSAAPWAKVAEALGHEGAFLRQPRLGP